MKREFFVQCKAGTFRKRATDHRNAVLLVVNEHKLNAGDEVVVAEMLPSSKYVVFEQMLREIEMAVT